MRFIFHFVRNNQSLMIKYATIGVGATLIDFTVYLLLTDYAHLYYVLASGISFTLASFFNFGFNRFWTFKSNGHIAKEYVLFLLVALTGLAINSLSLFAIVELFKVHDILAKVLATALSTIGNFIGNKYITFKK